MMIEAAPDQLGHLRDKLESPDYTGHVAWALFNDPDLMRFNGRTIVGAEVGKAYCIKDHGDRFPSSVRDDIGVQLPAYASYKVK